MATYRGLDGQVKWITDTGTPAVVGEVTNWEFTTEAEIIKDTALGDTWNTNLVGLKSWTGSAEMNFDSADGAQADALEGENLDIIFVVRSSAGVAATTGTFTGNALVSRCTVTDNGTAGVVSYRVELVGTGALVRS